MVQASKPTPYHPPLVVSAHGIRTDGKWQKTFASVISGTPTKVESFDYGKYGLSRFLIPSVNNGMIGKFYEWYSQTIRACGDVDLDQYDKRPSLAAHSFGTWIIGYAMLKHDDIRFDKIIFFGSILPRDFDWATLFARDQVSEVRNECGQRDPWPIWAGRFIAKAGTGGVKGFEWYGSAVKNIRCEDFGHDEFYLRRHMQEHWLSFLRQPPSPLSILHGHEVHNRAQFEELLTHTRTKIDSEAYGELPHYQGAALPGGLSMTWIRVNPDIYTFLIDRMAHIPAGYINAMPVTERAYGLIREGQLLDKDITAADILPFDEKPVKLYLMSIAIAENHRRLGDGLFHQAYVKLLAGLLDKLIFYARTNRTRVSHLLATAWTPEGHRICESFGMSVVGADRFKDPIYELDLSSLVDREAGRVPGALRRVIKTYRELDSD